jgi:probable addiction module antidote protein
MITRFDPAEYLETEESIANFLKLAAERKDKEHLASCRASVITARMINRAAAESGISRRIICDIVLNGAPPSGKTFVKVSEALAMV